MVAFSNFIDDSFLIIPDYAAKLGKGTAPKMKLLANEGVLLIEGTLKGEKESKLFLSYKGVSIAEGNRKEIAHKINSFLSKGSNNMINHLEKLFFVKTGSGGGFKYVDEVVSSKMVRQD